MSEYRFFLFQKLLVLATNVLVIAGLILAMYRASLYPEDFNGTFFITLFAVIFPVLLFGYLGKCWLSRRFAGYRP